MIWRLAQAVVGIALIFALGLLAWRWGVDGDWRLARLTPAAQIETRAAMAIVDPGPPSQAPCPPAPAFAPAASQNAASLSTAAWSVFGRPEAGWEIYAPLTAAEIGTTCLPDSPGFAQALATWQADQRLTASGVMDAPTLDVLRVAWLRRRPFVAASAHGVCPPPPNPDRLSLIPPDEAYGVGLQLRTGALEAHRRMIEAARAESPDLAADPRLLRIFSGYRDPVPDAVRCALMQDCGTIVRANCSAHRTGLAMDLFLGSAPGHRPDSADDANRLFQSRSPAYRWMVLNAGRFGFVNYAFEPWHWEWIGEAP